MKARLGILVSFGLLAVLTGCSSTTAFSDTSSVVIVGTLPPPPPPPPPKRVEITADQIVIHDKILFEVNKAVIREESHSLVDEIVQVVKDNGRIKKLSIEGHTDGDGSEKYNQALSDKRATAVMQYLVDHGVAQDRLTSKGLGESKPLADNATAEGKEKNRRVEFLISEQDEVKKTFEVDPTTGEKREVTDTKPETKPETKEEAK